MCSLCLDVVISTDPKTVVRIVGTKEATPKTV